MIFADLGLPMVFISVQIMAVAFAAIVAVEALVYARYFGLRFRDVLPPAFWSNLKSTFIGIPIAWVVMLALEISTTGGKYLGDATPIQRLARVTLQAAWPPSGSNDAVWLIPAVSLSLLLPFLIASVLIERGDLRHRMPAIPADRKLATGVWLANLFSYGLLGLFYLVWYATTAPQLTSPSW